MIWIAACAATVILLLWLYLRLNPALKLWRFVARAYLTGIVMIYLVKQNDASSMAEQTTPTWYNGGRLLHDTPTSAAYKHRIRLTRVLLVVTNKDRSRSPIRATRDNRRRSSEHKKGRSSHSRRS
ncbi:hypothetical protein Ddc_21937 [Ditylenchus destructor]|nr:hypothetical protein Ddc_21937 [Ditylenchus destructor]